MTMIELVLLYVFAAVFMICSKVFIRRRRDARAAADEARPPRTQMFSEAHPNAWHMIRTRLPQLHCYLLALVVCYITLPELLQGNYLFWYEGSWILPTIIEVTSSQAALEAWWVESGTFFIICVAFITLVLWTLYNMVWRSLFKDYYRVIYKDWSSRLILTERKEGRIYWYTDNMWHRLWDRWYGSPPRTKHYIWIRSGRYPLLNPFNPASSMTRIELSPEEWIEVRGYKKIYGHEKPIRERVGIRQLITTDKRYTTVPVPLAQAKKEFDTRTGTLVMEMRELTKGNAAIRLEKLKNIEIAEEGLLHTIEQQQAWERAKRECNGQGKVGG